MTALIERQVLEHAALFNGFLTNNENRDFDQALRYQKGVIERLHKTSAYSLDVNRDTFYALGGVIRQEPVNKQDPTSTKVSKWLWGNDEPCRYADFIHSPLAPMGWLDLFPGLHWRLEKLSSGYGAKVYRTVHTHPLPTVALTIACVHYSFRLMTQIQMQEYELE